jgi:cobalt/nickel transport system permease protein
LANGNDFIERSILGALSFIKEAVFADEAAVRPGLLQRLTPKVKLPALLLLIMLTVTTNNFTALLILYLLCLGLALMSRIGLGYFWRRTLLFIPLFSLFIAFPSIFSIITPGPALLTFMPGLAITRPGLWGAVLFVGRVTTAVSFATLLSLTTRHFILLKTLQSFRVPQIYVMTLGMCYRYIFLFIETVENTYLAIKSRVGGRLHYRKGQRVVAWNIGTLWLKSAQLSEDVYKAMLARGFNGEARTLEP